MKLLILDGDVTIWDISYIYDDVKEAVAKKFREVLGVEEEKVIEFIDDKVDVKRFKKYGPYLNRFFETLLISYGHFLGDRDYDTTVEDFIRAQADRIPNARPRVYPDAKILEKLHQKGIKLAMLTSGDRTIQQTKLLSLPTWFKQVLDKTYVVYNKTADDYRAILKDFFVEPEETAVVGDSLERDLKPAYEVGISNLYLIERKDRFFSLLNKTYGITDFAFKSIKSLEELEDLL